MATSDIKCVNEYTRIDQIVATVILVLFFLIGTLSNLSFISIYLHKQRRRCTSGVMGGGGGGVLGVTPNGVSIRSTCIRIKNQVSNKAIFTLSISNLLLSSLFIPYTIVFRVWNVDAPWFILLVLEHFKDNLLYMNLLIITILSIERYVAVCKPQHYKKLESNINKIIWIVFLIGFVLSGTNYAIDVKVDLVCSANIFIHHNNNQEQTEVQSLNSASASSSTQEVVFAAAINSTQSLSALSTTTSDVKSTTSTGGGGMPINLNLLTSGVIFSLSACISTFFYVQIAWHHLKRARQFKHKCSNSGSDIKRVNSLCNGSGLHRSSTINATNSSSERVKLNEKNETTATTTTTISNKSSSENRSSFRESRGVGGGNGGGVGVGDPTSYVLISGERQFSRQFSNNSEAGMGAETTTTNQATENDDLDLSKCKSDASVQTDFVLRKSKKILKKKYSNIFATNLITKISIWLSVIIWVSILPFLLSVLELVPYYRFIYFLYYIENVFSPLVYICLNKRYRNYLKKVFKLKIKK